MLRIGGAMKFAKPGVAILLVSALAIAAWPQQSSPSSQSSTTGQQESLADAARRTKEQKKEQPKAAKVWDNDNIPETNGNISVVGQPSEPAPAESSVAQKTEKKTAAITPEEKADLQKQLDNAKAHLAALKTDLDIAQRKYTLDEQTYISNPNHERDEAGAAALDDEKRQIADQQAQITEAQKKVDDLQAQLEAASSNEAK
jgi:cell fate regulator YaaT (PSP1 superfamily)